MTPKEKVRRYKKWAEKHTTEQLYQRYKSRVKTGTAAEISAREEVTAVLNAVKVYEYYVQDLEKMYKKELDKMKKELLKAQKQIQSLQKKQVQMEAKIKGLEVAKTTEKGAQLKSLEKTARGIDKTFARMQKEATAKVRGDNIGEAIGRRSHDSKDPYDEVLNALETTSNLYMHPNRRRALANSEDFRSAFYNRFAGRISQEEMEEKWEKNFGPNAKTHKMDEYVDWESKDKISWNYQPNKGFKKVTR